MTVTSPKFVVKIPEENITKKIERSAKQCADIRDSNSRQLNRKYEQITVNHIHYTE